MCIETDELEILQSEKKFDNLKSALFDNKFLHIWFLSTKNFTHRHRIFYSLLNFTIGQLALPVYLAELDWSNLISSSEYYGYGFKWILTPLFRFVKNPYYIYVYSLAIYAVLVCITGIAFYRVVVGHWNMHNNIFNAVIFGCVFRVHDPIDAYSSEIALLISFFITCVVIIKLIDNSQHRIILSIFLSFWLCYMITLHERALVVFLSIIIIFFLYRIVYKQFIVEMRVFIPCFLIFFWLERILTKKYQLFFWKEKILNGNLDNTSVLLNNNMWFLDSFANLKIFFEEICANLLTLTVHSYGIFLLVISSHLIGLISLIFLRKYDKINEFFEQNKSVIMIIVFSTIATLGVIAGVGVRWGAGIAAGNTYCYKGYGYYRYFLVFIWPAFLGILTILPNIKNDKFKRAIFLTSVLLELFLILFWLNINEKVDWINRQNADTEIERVGLFEFVDRIVPTDSVLISVKIGLVSLVITIFCIKVGKSFKWLAIIIVITNIINITNVGKDIHCLDFTDDDFYDIYDYFQQVEKDFVLPQTIYIEGDSFYVKKSQLLLPRHSIKKYNIKNFSSEENSIVLSWNGSLDELMKAGWENMEFDNGVKMYINSINMTTESEIFEVSK